MPAISIQPTYPVFTGLDGLPLDAGYLWFGVANLDPQTNPTTIYWDEAMTIVAPQPVRTLAGYPSRSGTPARIFIATDYSVRVQDNKGVTVYNASFVAVEDPNVAPFVIENDTGQEITISMDGSDFAFNHTQAGDFLTYDNGTGDIYFSGVAAGASTADFASIAATVSPNGVTTGTILNSAVTTDKINNLAVTTAKVANANITAAKLDGAQTGTAPIYGARAWVNFNGAPATGTYGRNATLVTVNMTAHGMTSGQIANLTFSAGTGGTATSGSYAVTVLDANNFTITDSASGTITGSPSVTRNNYIRASGNVSSITDNGTGDYTVNFSTAMPDANYSAQMSLSGMTLIPLVRDYTTTSVRVTAAAGNNVQADQSTVSVAIHR